MLYFGPLCTFLSTGINLETLEEQRGAGGDDDDIPYLQFASDAQDLFDEWRANLERRLRTGELSDTPAYESHLAKYRSLMPSLALIFHLVNAVSGKTAGPVSVEAASIAADWCGYLEAHARKIYAPELNPDVAVAHRLADKIRAGAITDGMTIRDIYRPQWSGLTNTDTVCAGLEILNRHNWLRVIEQDTGGRPSDIIEVHPTLRKDAA